MENLTQWQEEKMKEFDEKYSDIRDNFGVSVVGYPATREDIKSFLFKSIKEAYEMGKKSQRQMIVEIILKQSAKIRKEALSQILTEIQNI